MAIPPLHDWDVTPKEAVALQRRLAGQVRTEPLVHWGLIAGADVSYNRFSSVLYAAVVLYRPAERETVETVSAVGEAKFPYVPGLLSFREIPIVLEAFRKLRQRPDAVMCDAQGYSHPRRFGLACHLGLLLDLPTLGCAKSLLCGDFAEPAVAAGSTSPLLDGVEQIGTVLRTRSGVKPVFILVGHRIDLTSATALAIECVTRYRIPEPTRRAHLAVNELRKAEQKKAKTTTETQRHREENAENEK